MGSVEPLAFGDAHCASLDGVWDFLPGDHALEELASLEPEQIRVPGLWEAQGWIDLDGVAWYRRRFVLDDAAGHWTLRFGAVMDLADVYLNRVLLGSNDSPFTPFELDPGRALVAGENELAVRVVDPPADDPEHPLLAHGKQGWMNHIFPSRPSLYITYGGIWQPVTLRRHGPVTVRDVFVNGDPDDLVVTAEVENRADEPLAARVAFRTLALVRETDVDLSPGASATVEARLGATTAARWRPDEPALHHALVDACVDGEVSDTETVRYGLRTVRLEGARLLLSEEPYRMKSALVQGFRADTLYAEGDREAIREEVLAARAMGFNTLRLHIKAFDPAYLDVCDEEGMLLHCDIPVAEPIEYGELHDGTLLSRRCVAAADEQVRRDRNHPSVILWSAMNEVALERRSARRTPAYEQFARTLVATVQAADPTRPVIENDWIEPDPDYVFASPILTAHWYGRLHADYLHELESRTAEWAASGRPFFVTEFGDWGLPDMPELPEPPFWDAREVYASALAQSLWPGTIGRFVVETQRYQGLSDRLQAEIFRRHDGLGGYCVTELTDVPRELNGLLDLDRRPKRIAVEELTRANQTVLPMLELPLLVVAAGERGRGRLHVANDGPELVDVRVEARFGGSPEPASVVEAGRLPAYRAVELGELTFEAPRVPGSHDLVLRLSARGRLVSENRYPLHVVAVPAADLPVRVVGDADARAAAAAIGARVGDEGPTIVGEGALDEAAGEEARGRLAAGETVVVLAQPPSAAEHFPVPLEIVDVQTRWGSSVFHFTTDESPLASLPRRTVLVTEDSTIQARSVIGSVEGGPFVTTPVVIAYKPDPRAMTGTVVGSHRVGEGLLVVCQYRVTAPAAAGDAAARAMLADLVRWASGLHPQLAREATAAPDGRELTSYRFGAAEPRS